ncbi:UDP-N-acetylmuramate dehydrogenase [bacterium]|nr:UDP-N-acetylmuramate dehydrogenase [bacterium]
MNVDFQRLFSDFKGKILLNEVLAPYVAFRIGGPADCLLFPDGEKDLALAAEIAKREQLPFAVLGAGSNLLVGDKGIRGVVVFLGAGKEDEIQFLMDNGKEVTLNVPAHCTKAALVDFALENKLSGVEFSAGIPGTLGGAVYMNAGTKWGSYSEVIESVRFFRVGKGFYEKPVEALGFKYRGHGEELFAGGAIVVSACLRLRHVSSRKEIQEKMDEILKYRGGKQPLELPNCGSVFKNPEKSRRGAGRLIEACNLKGTCVGGAQVSLKHANFILNLGNATSKDVETLIKKIQKKVFSEFKVELETEVIKVGE